MALHAMKVVSILLIELVGLLALVESPADIIWLLVVTGTMFFTGILLLYDKTSSYVLLAGSLMVVSLIVSSLTREFEVLQLWSLFAIGLSSIILGIAAAGQSKIASGISVMDETQERLLLREVLRAVGVSLMALLGVMILSLSVLSLTFLAQIGLSSAAVMAALAIIAMLSLGALVAMRERI